MNITKCIKIYFSIQQLFVKGHSCSFIPMRPHILTMFNKLNFWSIFIWVIINIKQTLTDLALNYLQVPMWTIPGTIPSTSPSIHFPENKHDVYDLM